MSSSEPTNGGSAPPDPSDRELLESLRAGDDEAYGRLWRRHQPAALRAARQYDRGPEAEDIAAEAFARVLDTVRQGDGPLEAFRAYLLRSVAQVAQNARSRRGLSGQVGGYGDATLEALDQHFIARAYDQLTPEQREILWYIDVERLPLGDAATMLGVAPGTAATLAAEARDALGREYLQVHMEQRADQPGCAATLERVPTYIRGGAGTLQRMRIERHIGGCASCSLAVAELNEIGAGLREVLGPLVLGTAASFGYFAESTDDFGGTETGATPAREPSALGSSARDSAASNASASHASVSDIAAWNGSALASGIGASAGLLAADRWRDGAEDVRHDGHAERPLVVGVAAGSARDDGGAAYGGASYEPKDNRSGSGYAGAKDDADTSSHGDTGSSESRDAAEPDAVEPWADDADPYESVPTDLRRFATPKAAAVAGVAVLALSGLALAGVLMGGEDDTAEPARVQAAETPNTGAKRSPEDRTGTRPEPTPSQTLDQEETDSGRRQQQQPVRFGGQWSPSTPSPEQEESTPSPSRRPTLQPPRVDGEDGGSSGEGGVEPLRVTAEVLSDEQWRTGHGVTYVALQADRLEPGATVRLELDAPTFTHLTAPVGTLPDGPTLSAADDDTWTCQVSGLVSASGYDCTAKADARGRILAVFSTRSTLGALNRAAYDVSYLFRSGLEVETGSVRVR